MFVNNGVLLNSVPPLRCVYNIYTHTHEYGPQASPKRRMYLSCELKLANTRVVHYPIGLFSGGIVLSVRYELNFEMYL